MLLKLGSVFSRCIPSNLPQRNTEKHKENDVCKNENRTSFSSPLKYIYTFALSTQDCVDKINVNTTLKKKILYVNTKMIQVI